MKKMARIGGLVLVASLLAVPALWAADAGSAKGQVVDGNRKAIANMTVRATDVVDPSKTFTAPSDRDGKFLIPGLPAGSYLVSADTVNTSWVQKDESPIVEVSASAAPMVTLVLLKASELAAAAPKSGGGTALQVATIGVATLAAAGSIVSLAQVNDLEDQNDELRAQSKQQYEDLNRQLDQLDRSLTLQIQDLERQLADLQKDLAYLGGQNEELQRQIADLQRQIEDLRDLVDRRTSSPRR